VKIVWFLLGQVVEGELFTDSKARFSAVKFFHAVFAAISFSNQTLLENNLGGSQWTKKASCSCEKPVIRDASVELRSVR